MNEIIEKLKERLAEREEWIIEDNTHGPYNDLEPDGYINGYRCSVEEEILFLKACLSVLKDSE